jgi:hypothetical protein
MLRCERSTWKFNVPFLLQLAGADILRCILSLRLEFHVCDIFPRSVRALFLVSVVLSNWHKKHQKYLFLKKYILK